MWFFFDTVQTFHNFFLIVLRAICFLNSTTMLQLIVSPISIFMLTAPPNLLIACLHLSYSPAALTSILAHFIDILFIFSSLLLLNSGSHVFFSFAYDLNFQGSIKTLPNDCFGILNYICIGESILQLYLLMYLFNYS